MDSFLDFCLACDGQTNGATYCSQACRLAELDHSTYLPQSFSYADSHAHRSSSTRARPLLALPPAYNFSMHLHRVSSQTSISSVQTSTSRMSTLSEQVRGIFRG